jgi:hypothetical protein
MKTIRRPSQMLAATALALGLCLPSGSPPAAYGAEVENQHQLVPAYFYPDWYNPGNKWYRMCAAMNASSGSSVAIMNPASGPGTKANTDYKKVLAYCHAKKQKVIGYVATGYGTVDRAKVAAAINKYYSFYPGIDGIFLDEMANDPAKAAVGSPNARAYYRSLYKHIKARTAGTELVVGNPGAAAKTAWQLADPAVDIAVIFEGTKAKYATWKAPAWVSTYRATRFSHLVYDTKASSRQQVCAASRTRNAGYLYVTNDVLPNPWDTLPPYWSQEAPVCK